MTAPTLSATPRLVRSALLCLAVLCGPVAAVTPASLKTGTYAVRAENASAAELLRMFAGAFGLRLKMEPLAGGTRMNGKIEAPTPIAFVERLSAQHGFDWFVHAGSMYVSPSDRAQTARLAVGADRIAVARSIVTSRGLLESKFGWAESPDEGVVVVSGPPDYVRLVQTALKELTVEAKPASIAAPAAPASKEVMVFRLRHANAEDRSLVFRGQIVPRPGLASILRETVNGRADQPTQIAMSPMALLPGVVSEPPVRDLVRSAVAQTSGGDPVRIPAGLRTSVPGPFPKTYVSIEADARINALLIHDFPERRGYYERLIQELDVAQQLVEIEAVIIDIDRSLLSELGVEWTVAQPRVGGTTALAAVPGLPATTLIIPDIASFFARLRALDTRGKVAIFARPSILTLDNQAAVLDLSQTDFLRVVGERVAEIREVTAGTLLRVVPRVQTGPVGSAVQLLIDIEDGSLQTDPGRTTPLVQRNTISTQAVVDVGQSLVVGGYRAAQQRDEVNKVPLLGDLPWVGGLFRTTRSQDRQMERLFIITPRQVNGAQGAVAAPRAPAAPAIENAERMLAPQPAVPESRTEAGA